MPLSNAKFGTAAQRPDADQNNKGLFWYSTDTGDVEFSTGDAWEVINASGGGGASNTVDITAAAQVGDTRTVTVQIVDSLAAPVSESAGLRIWISSVATGLSGLVDGVGFNITGVGSGGIIDASASSIVQHVATDATGEFAFDLESVNTPETLYVVVVDPAGLLVIEPVAYA